MKVEKKPLEIVPEFQITPARKQKIAQYLRMVQRGAPVWPPAVPDKNARPIEPNDDDAR